MTHAYNSGRQRRKTRNSRASFCTPVSSRIALATRSFVSQTNKAKTKGLFTLFSVKLNFKLGYLNFRIWDCTPLVGGFWDPHSSLDDLWCHDFPNLQSTINIHMVRIYVYINIIFPTYKYEFSISPLRKCI